MVSEKALSLVVILLLSMSAGTVAQPIPLPRAHSHNDYLREHPLYDALAYGFCSVEADIHLISGELYVAHDALEIRKGITLESLYLGPLRERVHQNNGAVYRNGPHFTLLIDIKTEAQSTYETLHKVLEEYEGILTVFGTDRVIKEGPAIVIVSGNRSRVLMESQKIRYAAYDGRIEDLGANAGLIPLVSDNWDKLFTWQGRGAMPEEEHQRLKGIVKAAHADGQRVRFCDTR